MPTCDNCDGQDFLLQDGHYYCVVCNLQSQEVVEQVLDEFDAAAYAVESRKAASKTQKNVVDRGKPWYTVEAFQVILKSQIAALVDLGCSPQLYDTSKQLWFKYVHKSGIAVIDSSLPAAQKPSDRRSCKTFRDRYLNGQLGKRCLKDKVFPDVCNAHSKLIHMPTYMKSGKKRELESSSSESSDNDDEIKSPKSLEKRKLKHPLHYDKMIRLNEDWNSFSDSSSESDDVTFSTQEYYKSNVKVHSNPAASAKQKIPDLSLMRLVTLLYIALQWNEEPVTPGDIIQWVKQGYLPYIDCLKSLHPHMKVSDYDIIYFRNSVVIPSYEMIVALGKEMSEYLEIHSQLPEVDIRKLLARYIIQLNLPHSLMSFTNTLINVTNYKYERPASGYRSEYYSPECAALSLVVIVCKLLFGLDDAREWKLIEEVKPCSDHGACRPFSWKDWADYHVSRLLDERRNPPHCFAACDSGAVDDLHSYITHWKEVVLKSASQSKETKHPRADVRSLKDRAQAKSSAFAKLCDLQGSTGAMETNAMRYPYVFLAPHKDNNMGGRCLKCVMKFLEQDDCDYVFYSDSYSRMEGCFKRTYSSCHYRIGENCWSRGDADTHMSYDFLLAMAQTVSGADKILIHSKVQEVERKFLAPFLEAKQTQKFTTTTWHQSARRNRALCS